jgi:CheY-like chemotaxis protein
VKLTLVGTQPIDMLEYELTTVLHGNSVRADFVDDIQGWGLVTEKKPVGIGKTFRYTMRTLIARRESRTSGGAIVSRTVPRRGDMAKTILIVDDNAYVREAVCELFKREEDFTVCGEATNGREAIAKALELHPDLVVLDHSMPVMNGLDAARELKRLMPTVPLIMYTAFGDVLGEQQARLVGISELVSKSQPAAILVNKAADCSIKTRRSHLFSH